MLGLAHCSTCTTLIFGSLFGAIKIRLLRATRLGQVMIKVNNISCTSRKISYMTMIDS